MRESGSMIKLDEFTNEELNILADLVYKQIDFKRDLKNKTSIDRMKDKIRKDIMKLELLSVKINNHLGESK